MFKMAEPSDFNDINLEEHKKYLCRNVEYQ